RKPGDVARSCSPEPGFAAVRAAQPEIDQRLARRLQQHARSFGGDPALKMQKVDHASLRQLRLGKRRGHAQDWLVGEENRSLRPGVYVARKAEARQLFQPWLAEECGPR